MPNYFFKNLLQNDGWKKDVLIQTDEQGIITRFTEHSTVTEGELIEGFALPGFQNAHSHAFQYAMAGLAEVHSTTSDADSFWSWRDAMYKLALSIDPDDLESIAAMLYSEMVRQGYTNVAEFHYVHHDKDGKPYSNLAEMGERLVAAAEKSGINITLVPIFYQKGGFGKDPLEGQKRFISKDADTFLKLLEASCHVTKDKNYANVGIGIHSMRGVEPDIIREIAKSDPSDIPFHIHIAEQLKEIDDSIAYLGKRPVEWFLDNIDLSDRFQLVHATHLTDEETAGIARSGASVVLCPTTEGNLGDGIFPLNRYHEFNGHWSIGTDSHIGINPFEELRLLDYGQRLISHNRKTFALKNGDSGLFAIEMACLAGRKAMNNYSNQFFAIGHPLNACVISSEHPLVSNSCDTNRTSSILYSTDAALQSSTIVNGKMVVRNGKHYRNEELLKNFTKTITKLGNRS